MPDVPVDDINEVGPQAASGTPTPMDATPGDYGAGIGQALVGIGAEMRHYQMREQRYADQEAAQDALTQVGIKRMQLLKDPNSGLLSQDLNDPAALAKASDKAMADFNAHVDQVGEKLTTDHQRAIFSRGLREQRFGMESSVLSYQHDQGNRIATSKMDNGVKVEQANAAHFYDAPMIDHDTGKPVDPVAASIKKQTDLIKTTGDYLHWTPEQIQVAQAKAVNDTHVGVMQAKLVPGKDANRAADYFAAHKGDMFPQEADHFGRAVESAVLGQQTGAITGELMTGKDGRPRAEADVLDAMASDKRLLADDKLATSVENQVQRQFRLRKGAEQERQGKTFDGVWNAMPSIGGDLSQIPPDVMTSLSPEHQRQLQAYSKQFQDGKSIPDSSDTFYAVQSMAVDPKGAQRFADMDLRTIKASVSQKDYRTLLDLQMEKRGKATPGAKGVNVVSTKEEILKPVIHGMNEEDANDFRRKLDQAVEAQGGMEKVGTAGLQKLADQLTIQTATKTPRSWYNPARWVGDHDATEQAPAFKTLPKGYAFGVHQIPGDKLDAQREKAKGHGITNPSDQQLVDAYNADLTHAGP